MKFERALHYALDTSKREHCKVYVYAARRVNGPGWHWHFTIFEQWAAKRKAMR